MLSKSTIFQFRIFFLEHANYTQITRMLHANTSHFTVYTHITKNGYISKHTPSIVDETTNLHVNIDDKEIELLIIASIETLTRQKKKKKKVR